MVNNVTLLVPCIVGFGFGYLCMLLLQFKVFLIVFALRAAAIQIKVGRVMYDIVHNVKLWELFIDSFDNVNFCISAKRLIPAYLGLRNLFSWLILRLEEHDETQLLTLSYL